jgi:hypothetical protein
MIVAWIATIVGAIVVLLGGLANIREKILAGGWDRPSRVIDFLRRASQRSAAQRILHDTATLDAGFFQQHGNAVSVALARQRLPSGVRSRPDEHLVEALKRWTIELKENDWRGLHHYVDTMGAVCHSDDEERNYAEIMHAWIAKLQAVNAIEPFDCLLTVKGGNPILVHKVGRRLTRSADLPVHTVICKGPRDPAKVSAGPDSTDFEGLSLFRQAKPIARMRDSRYRALAIDDNCTSGRSLLDAIDRFNDFVGANADDYPFEPVNQVVVLFVVKDGGENVLVDSDQVTLHALLALGETEMVSLVNEKTKKLRRNIASLKEHEACSVSRTLGESWSPS